MDTIHQSETNLGQKEPSGLSVFLETNEVSTAMKLEEFKPLKPLFQVTVYNWRPILYTTIIVSMKFHLDRKLSREVLEISEAL